MDVPNTLVFGISLSKCLDNDKLRKEATFSQENLFLKLTPKLSVPAAESSNSRSATRSRSTSQCEMNKQNLSGTQEIGASRSTNELNSQEKSRNNPSNSDLSVSIPSDISGSDQAFTSPLPSPGPGMEQHLSGPSSVTDTKY